MARFRVLVGQTTIGDAETFTEARTLALEGLRRNPRPLADILATYGGEVRHVGCYELLGTTKLRALFESPVKRAS